MIRSRILLGLVVAAACGGAKKPTPAPSPDTKVSDVAPTPDAKPDAKPEVKPPDPYELQTKWLRSYAEAYNKHDPAAIGKMYTEDAVLVELGAQGIESKGRANIEEDHKGIFGAFPDAKVAITRSWHIKDVVIFEYIEGGTNTVDIEGHKATKKPYGMIGASILWFTPDGHVKREQVYSDELTMEHQVGWLDPKLAKIEVRPIMKVPDFTGTWEQHKATGAADEAGITQVREKLYTHFSMNSEKEFIAMLTDDIVMAAYDDPKDAVGKPAVGKALKEWIKMIKGLKFDAELSWGCDGFAIVQGRYGGKHVGAWGPIKATQKEFTTHFLDISRVTKDGKIDRMWTFASNAELLLHIGVRKVAK